MRITNLDNFTRVEVVSREHGALAPDAPRCMISTNEPVRMLYTACASDLELERWPAMPEDVYMVLGLYRNGPTRGVTVIGARHEVNFVVVGLFFQGEGEDRELAGWYLEPTEESMREVPGCRGIQLEIYND